MEFNNPYKYGDSPLLEPKLDFVSESQRVYFDDRNFGRRDVQLLKLGDLWRPWYFFKDLGNHETNCPVDTNRISILYDVTIQTLDPLTVGDCCFNHAHRFGDGHFYDSDGLDASIKEKGQTHYVDVVTHYKRDNTNGIIFKDGSKTSDTLIFEGHHRKHALLKAKIPMEARVYHLYDLEYPISIKNLKDCYNSSYDDSFWSSYQTDESKLPWFILEQFESPERSHKYNPLMKCFKFLSQKGIKPNKGVDIGCGEGLYTYLANKHFNIPFVGIDSERGQILRAMLAKMIYNIPKISPVVGDWNNFPQEIYDSFDMGLLLSISHHMNNWPEFIKKFAKNKKGIIAECRHSNGQAVFGSIKKFQNSNEIIDSLLSTGMKVELVDVLDGDRNFYCLWND